MSLSLETDENVQYLPYYEDGDRISGDEMEEDETPSLCDLPFSTGYQDQVKEENRTGEEGDDYFDFNFNSNSNFNFDSIIGSRPELESEMCTADEIFSGGQLLPFHHSVRFPSRSVSRSESMDRVRFGSRSSSTTSSSSCSSYNSIKSMGIPNTKTRNQFHSYPSPNPRVRAAGARFSTSSMPSSTKSTMWQVLRLGLVRTPEIELQGRTSHYNRALNKCTGSGSSSNNSNSDIAKSTNSNYQLLSSHEITNSSSGGIFKSCKCSVGAIEPMFVRFRADSDTKTAIGRRNKSLADQILNEDKNLAQKKQEQRQQRNRQNSELRQGKQVVSHHRTFEWLRDLSHASVLNS